jgi:hypothetical protein
VTFLNAFFNGMWFKNLVSARSAWVTFSAVPQFLFKILCIIFSDYEPASMIAILSRHTLIERLRCTFNEK